MRCFTGRFLAISFALGLVPAAAGAEPPAPSDAAPADTISYGVGTWGRLTYQWIIRADGSGEVRSQDETSSDFHEPTLLVRRFRADSATFQQVRALLRLPETYTQRELHCVVVATDGPQGRLLWSFQGRGRGLSLIYACQSDEARHVYEAVNAADAIVWARVDGRAGERHRSSELPDIDPATIIPRAAGEAQ